MTLHERYELFRKACATFVAALSAKRPQDTATIWTSEIQRLRAQAFVAAYRLMLILDPRVEQLGSHPMVAQLMLPLFAMLPAEATRIYSMATPDEIAFDARWALDAHPAFNLTPSVAANFLLTDPAKIDEGDVPWPFTAFRVLVPPEAGLVFTDPTGATVAVQDFRVLGSSTPAHDTATPVGTPLRELYAARTLEKIRVELHKVLDEQLNAYAGLDSRQFVLVRAYDKAGMSVFHNAEWGGTGTFCGEWLEDRVELTDNPLFGGVYDLRRLDELALLHVRRIAINLALYLRSRREDTGARVWLPTSKASSTKSRTWTIGGAVRVGREVQEAARAVARGAPRSDVRVHHIVRGHFKRAGADKRSIYVAPYWRGPAEGPAVPREYDVR